MKNLVLRPFSRFLICGALGIAASQAIAQSTGNPKGSVAPQSSEAQKVPAARAATVGPRESGKIVTDESTARARTQTSKPPVSIGGGKATRDGEPGRTGSGAAAAGADPSARPAPQ